AAADTGAGHDSHLTCAQKIEIEPAVEFLGIILIVDPCVGRLARILFRIPAAAAFQDEHLLAPFCEAAGGYSPAKSTADDDYVIVVSHEGSPGLRMDYHE